MISCRAKLNSKPGRDARVPQENANKEKVSLWFRGQIDTDFPELCHPEYSSKLGTNRHSPPVVDIEIITIPPKTYSLTLQP